MSEAGKIKVLLAEDHILVREGTRELLQRESDIEVIGEADDGSQAVALASKTKPDVVIMDIAMPKLNGIDATRQIKSLLPDTAVLVLTAYDSDQYIFAILEAGAAGYLLKNVRGRELVDAVRAVHAGESVLHAAVTRRVIARLASSTPHHENNRAIEPLTARELQVLKLAGQGMSNQEIAKEIVVSPRTVQAHLGNIFTKLQVASRTEAVLYGLKRGWLNQEDLP